MKSKISNTAAACALIVCATNGHAQIVMATEPYQEEQKIQFSIEAPKPTVVVVPETKPLVVTPVKSIEVWTVRPASYLQDTLREWAKKAGWSVVWGLGEHEDFRFETGNSFEGDFKTAVTTLFDSMPNKIRIHAELRPDNTPPLIFVNREDGSR